MRVGIVGQISPHKGHDDVLEVLRLVPDVECLIFGKGSPSYIADLMKRSLEYEISDRIRWCGFVREQDAIYPRIDVLLVPSKCDDACPTVIMEAAFYGVPTVAYKRGGIPELIKDGETGFLVDTIEQMAEKVRLLM